MQITIFTSPTSKYCKLLKDFLKQKNVSFLERDIANETTDTYKGVPVIIVRKENGASEQIIGFNKNKLEQLLQ